MQTSIEAQVPTFIHRRGEIFHHVVHAHSPLTPSPRRHKTIAQ